MAEEKSLPSIGLCERCRSMTKVTNSRGSTFYLCELSSSDPRFARYPRLPVLACPGYKPRDENLPPSKSPTLA